MPKSQLDQLREQGWNPNKLAHDLAGQIVELISYARKEDDGRLVINIRTKPGDPSTLRTYGVDELRLIDAYCPKCMAAVEAKLKEWGDGTDYTVECYHCGRGYFLDRYETEFYADGRKLILAHTPVVGMGLTWSVGSDRYAGTITQILGRGKTFVYKEDNVKLITGSEEGGDAKYEYTPVKNGPELTGVWNRKRLAYRTGPTKLHLGIRNFRRHPDF